LDAQGYYGNIALAERCAYLLRQKGVHEPVDESLPGVTPKDVIILKEALSWFEFFEVRIHFSCSFEKLAQDAVELLKALPPPVCSERGDCKTMTERLLNFDLVMDGKSLKKFLDAPKEGSVPLFCLFHVICVRMRGHSPLVFLLEFLRSDINDHTHTQHQKGAPLPPSSLEASVLLSWLFL